MNPWYKMGGIALCILIVASITHHADTIIAQAAQRNELKAAMEQRDQAVRESQELAADYERRIASFNTRNTFLFTKLEEASANVKANTDCRVPSDIIKLLNQNISTANSRPR